MRRNGTYVALASLLLACRDEPKPQPLPQPAPANTAVAQAPSTVTSATPDPYALLRARLRRAVVKNDAFARRVLYSWTTDEQLDALKKGARFLTRSESPTTGASLFDQKLDAVKTGAPKTDDAAVAMLLRGGARGLTNRRFAWPEPWATRRPLGGTSYGDRLLRIVLADDSIVGHFDATATPRFRFSTLDGAPVAAAAVIKEPQRLAAIFHVSQGRAKQSFREYVVCNESRIAEWSYASADAVHELMSGSEMLHDMLRADSQEHLGPESSDLYVAALAFPDLPGYAGTRDNWEALADDLDRVRAKQGTEALVKKPNVAFDALPVAVAVQPSPRTRWMPT